MRRVAVVVALCFAPGLALAQEAVPEVRAGEAPPPVVAPAPPAAASPAPPVAVVVPELAQVADEARSLSPEVLESLGDAAVKYSWSGPLKWGGIGSGVAGVGLVVGKDGDNSKTLGKALIGVAAIQLGAALLIDMSARSSLADAGTVRAPRVLDPEEDDGEPKRGAVSKPDAHRDDYDL